MNGRVQQVLTLNVSQAASVTYKDSASMLCTLEAKREFFDALIVDSCRPSYPFLPLFNSSKQSSRFPSVYLLNSPKHPRYTQKFLISPNKSHFFLISYVIFFHNWFWLMYTYFLTKKISNRWALGGTNQWRHISLFPCRK